MKPTMINTTPAAATWAKEKLSYGALLTLTEGKGTSEIYERIQHLLTLHAQAVAAAFREGELSEAAKHADCCVDREAVAQAVRDNWQKLHTFPLCNDSGHEICHKCELTQLRAYEEREQDWLSYRDVSLNELKRVSARSATLEAGLKEIKEKYGKVCENYELCAHVSCQSSYSAWSIADELLTPRATTEEVFPSVTFPTEEP